MKAYPASSVPLFGLVGVLILAAVWRLLYLVYPVMDADQAINGLMARHILLGEFPVFFYGQEYCGALEAYLVSPIFLLLGASRLTLGAAIGLISLFLVFFVYQLAARILSPRPAVWAALLTAIPSNYFTFHSVLARSAYIESPVLGVLLFILAGRLLFAGDRRPVLYVMVGILSGLGLWTHFLFVFYLVPVGIFLLYREKGFFRDPKVLAYLSLGTFLGGLPLWLYNTIHPLATWHTLQGNPIHESFWESLKAFFSVRFPELLGLWSSLRQGYDLPYLSPAIYGILLAALVIPFYLRLRELRGHQGPYSEFGRELDLLLVFLLAYPLIFSFSGFAANHTTRYLTPLYPVVPILVTLLFSRWRKGLPALAWGLVALVLAVNLYGATWMAVVFQPRQVREYRQRDRVDQALFQFLKARNLRTVYVPDYWRAVPLTFNSREEILFAQPNFDRFPFFTRMVDRSIHPAFLLLGDAPVFENTLQGIGGTYKKQRLGDQWVFYAFQPPPFQFEELPVAGQRAEPDGPWTPAAAALDGDLGTRWHLGRPMQPGDFFQLDLGSLVPDIGRVVLLAGGPEGLPRGLRLEISRDGRNWNTLREVPVYWNSLHWSGPHPFVRSEKGISELIFSPQSGRFIRVTQTGSDRDRGWEIAELRVYRAIPVPAAPTPPPGRRAAEAEDRLRALNPQQVLASPWIRAQVDPRWSPWPEDPSGPGVGGRLSGKPSSIFFPALVTERRMSAFLRKALEGWAPRLYRQAPLGDWDLYAAPKTSGDFQRLSILPWRVSANRNPGEAWRAVDQKMETRWTSGAPQSPGLLFQVDLGRPERINRVRLLLGDSLRDFPRQLQILYSMDGKNWREAVPLNRPLYWDGERLLRDARAGETDRLFPEMPARFLALVQTGRDPRYYWSIHELEIYSP